MLMAYESLLCRFTRARAGSHRPRDAAQRGRHHVRRQSCQPQTPACFSARHGRYDAAATQRWSRADLHASPRRRATSPGGRRSRCHLARARPALECCPPDQHQPLDDWPRHPPPRPVAQKKSLSASERDPWDRARFLVQQEDIDPSDVVVVDEFGSISIWRRVTLVHLVANVRWPRCPATHRQT